MQTDTKVMIVEDSHTIRYEVKLLLDKIGVNLVEVANGLGMFNVIEEYGKQVDLIIMDLTLKNENGFDLIKRLKDNTYYKDIPILVLSEHAGRENVLKARELRVEGFLKKPIEKVEFLDRVRNTLKKHL